MESGGIKGQRDSGKVRERKEQATIECDIHNKE
jgi:hypothetical protein